PDAEPDRFAGSSRVGHTSTVVANADHQPPGPDSCMDENVRSAGVAMYVGQRLLNHTKNRPLEIWRQLVDLLWYPDPGNEAGAACKPLGEIAERGLEPVFCQVRGVQQVSEDP